MLKWRIFLKTTFCAVVILHVALFFVLFEAVINLEEGDIVSRSTEVLRNEQIVKPSTPLMVQSARRAILLCPDLCG